MKEVFGRLAGWGRRYGPVLWPIAKWLIGLGLIALIVWQNWPELQKIPALFTDPDNRVNLYSNLTIATIIYLSCIVLTFYRWYWLVIAQDLPFRVVDALRLGFIGFFFNNTLPGSVTGDLIKAALIVREQSRRTVAVATIIVDRIVGLYALILLVGFLGAVHWEQVSAVPQLRVVMYFVWSLAAGVAAAWFIFWLIPFRMEAFSARLGRIRFVGHILAEVVHAFFRYRDKGRYLVLTLALAVIGHIGFVLSFYYCSRAVPGDTPPVELHYVIVPVGMVVQAVPLTPGNIGVAEAAFGQLYQWVSPYNEAAANTKGVLACIAQRLVTWVVALIGLGFYLPLRRTVRGVLDEKKDATEETEPPTVPDEARNP